jgi:hypothetical protein
MNQPQALLNDRRACVAVSLFCVVESAYSWISIAKGVRKTEDLITALFTLFLIFAALSIAYRSSFWADRVVFSALAGAGGLVVLRAVHLPRTALNVIVVAYALLLTIAGIVSLIVLARGSRADTR